MNTKALPPTPMSEEAKRLIRMGISIRKERGAVKDRERNFEKELRDLNPREREMIIEVLKEE